MRICQIGNANWSETGVKQNTVLVQATSAQIWLRGNWECVCRIVVRSEEALLVSQCQGKQIPSIVAFWILTPWKLNARCSTQHLGWSNVTVEQWLESQVIRTLWR